LGERGIILFLNTTGGARRDGEGLAPYDVDEEHLLLQHREGLGIEVNQRTEGLYL
jgi:hypothetical protein